MTKQLQKLPDELRSSVSSGQQGEVDAPFAFEIRNDMECDVVDSFNASGNRNHRTS